MKSFSLCFLALVCFNCADPATTAATDSTVSLKVLEVTESEAKLILTNNSTNPIYYLGISQSSPLKSVEIFSDTGWTVVLWDWCGTGAERHNVQQGESTIILGPFI